MLGEINTSVSFYRESHKKHTKYAHVLRVFYTVSQTPVTEIPVVMSLKNFIPEITKGIPDTWCQLVEFEKATAARDRMAAWFRVTGGCKTAFK